MNSECARISSAPQYAKWLKPKVVGRANYVASPISRQMTWPKMRDFEVTPLCLPCIALYSIMDRSVYQESATRQLVLRGIASSHIQYASQARCLEDWPCAWLAAWINFQAPSTWRVSVCVWPTQRRKMNFPSSTVCVRYSSPDPFAFRCNEIWCTQQSFRRVTDDGAINAAGGDGARPFLQPLSHSLTGNC